MFLGEPKPCCQGCGELWIKAAEHCAMISCLDASKASCSSVFQRKGTLADSRWRKGAMMGAEAKLKES